MFLYENLINDIFEKNNIWDYYTIKPTLNLMRTNIKENDERIEYKVELPGFNKENVKITFKDSILNIKVSQKAIEEDKEDKEEYILKEINNSEMVREYKVNSNIDKDKISAKFENGILTVILPKIKIEDEDKEEYIKID